MWKWTEKMCEQVEENVEMGRKKQETGRKNCGNVQKKC